jgi:hypothetical protein
MRAAEPRGSGQPGTRSERAGVALVRGQRPQRLCEHTHLTQRVQDAHGSTSNLVRGIGKACPYRPEAGSGGEHAERKNGIRAHRNAEVAHGSRRARRQILMRHCLQYAFDVLAADQRLAVRLAICQEGLERLDQRPGARVSDETTASRACTSASRSAGRHRGAYRHERGLAERPSRPGALATWRMQRDRRA